MNDLRIAVATTRAVFGNIPDNLNRIRKWTSAAASRGASLICFPEMSVTGYFNHTDVETVAEPVPGPISLYLADLATEYRIVVLAGLAERSASGAIYASHLVVRPDGGTGIYRKLHIAPPEKGLLSPGTDVPLFSVEGYTFGIQLCYDAHFPELSTRMALKGADILFFPHASPRGSSEDKFKSWMRHLPARAFDNGLYVVACNQVGENGRGLSFPGITLVMGPSGEIVEKDTRGEEGMILADIRRKALDRVRNHRMRYFLPNRRGDVYT